MAIQHVTQVPYRRVQGLEATTQAQIERNFDSVVAQLVPTGAVLPWAGKNGLAVPQGWALCDGQALNRQAFASLYAVIGTEFGAGDGSTTFNVPNLSDRFPRGTHLGSEVGDTGGSANAVVVSHNHNLTVHANNFNTGTQSADHAHHTTTGGVSANHGHSFATDSRAHNHNNTNGVVFMNCSATHGHGGGCGQLAESPSYGGCTGFGCNMTTSTYDHNHGGHTAGIDTDHTHSGWSGGVNTNHSHNANHAHTTTIDAAGVSGTNANLPPYMDFRFIIKT